MKHQATTINFAPLDRCRFENLLIRKSVNPIMQNWQPRQSDFFELIKKCVPKWEIKNMVIIKKEGIRIDI